MELTVTELFVDPLAYLWYILLRELKRFCERKASGVLKRSEDENYCGMSELWENYENVDDKY